MELNLAVIGHTKNTAELIADVLRSAILQGKFRSGQALKQDEIAAELKISKIPVREALVQLQAEGLVRLVRSRGAVVSTLTLKEVDEIYTIRLALEPIALRQAIPSMTPLDFIQMEHILERIDHETDLSKWAELNWEFHAALYKPAQMPHLLQVTRELHNNVVRFLVYQIKESQLQKSQHQHREVLRKCREKDIEGACRLLIQHLDDPIRMYFANQV